MKDVLWYVVSLDSCSVFCGVKNYQSQILVATCVSNNNLLSCLCCTHTHHYYYGTQPYEISTALGIWTRNSYTLPPNRVTIAMDGEPNLKLSIFLVVSASNSIYVSGTSIMTAWCRMSWQFWDSAFILSNVRSILRLWCVVREKTVT